MNIEDRLLNILPYVEKPARYIGGEFNQIRKDLRNVRVKFAFAFPDAYEIGMSHTGMRILYDLLNKRS
ncbi:B12-binding domain-containing radical SAM protein, partial [bacterium]|nr:B12-binding domain-containing radical SAM protein [bacterium]